MMEGEGNSIRGRDDRAMSFSSMIGSIILLDHLHIICHEELLSMKRGRTVILLGPKPQDQSSKLVRLMLFVKIGTNFCSKNGEGGRKTLFILNVCRLLEFV
jgi:hypothetical protein